ncbi:MAG: class I SAM-dependent methyltransferase [Clostridia bacterium]|nr:class I SAM-dependent methyltransferase [Clostridia bacterium]
MWIADSWQDYELLDSGEGMKLERWKDVVLLRPDPQVIWSYERKPRKGEVHARYTRSSSGGGAWSFEKKVPDFWTVSWRDLTFSLRLMGFKHTGLFPEQAVNWDWMIQKIKSSQKPVKVLNLFGYTGAATVACASAGASVCHVDAAKNMVAVGKENLALSHLSDAPVRWIVDDCLKFVQREIRRGNRYDGILLDPPSYGRGPNGEVWHLEDMLFPFMEQVVQVLSDEPLFVLLNSYTTGLQPLVLRNVLEKTVVNRFGGQADAQEIGLKQTRGNVILPCGASGRWEKTNV